MASTFPHSLSLPKPLNQVLPHLHRTSSSPSMLLLISRPWGGTSRHFSIKCTSNSAPESHDDDDPLGPVPSSTTINNAEFPIEKRRRSDIVRERRLKQGLVQSEPPNLEIGWKRTIEIKTEKPVGYVIMDFLDKLAGLMDREFGSTELLAKAGEIVAERAREEAEVLQEEGKVEERMVTELFRVLKLMEMDLAMVKAAVKEETLSERLEQAKARCRGSIGFSTSLDQNANMGVVFWNFVEENLRRHMSFRSQKRLVHPAKDQEKHKLNLVQTDFLCTALLGCLREL